MKAFWKYRCDFGHSWTFFRDENACERPEDIVCPHGHEAVTLYKARALDMVQISLRPAAQIADPVTGQVQYEHKYYLVVTDFQRNVERMSQQPFTWNEAKSALERFRSRPDQPGTVSPSQAWQVMDQLDSEP